MKNAVFSLSVAVALVGSGLVAPIASVQASEVKAVKTVAPEYPRGAERRKIEGYVVLQYTITGDGKVQDVAVVEASPEGIFEDAATKAVTKWKFDNPGGSDITDKQTKISFKL